MEKGIVLIIDEVHSAMADGLKQQGYSCVHAEQASRDEIIALLPQAQGLVIRSRFTLDRDFLSKASQLRWIARSGVGMENIDTRYCELHGIQAFNAQGGNANAVGEHVIGMLLSLFNHISKADLEVRAGIWQREANRGIELGSRSVGIIGYGHTGRSLAQKLSGFGCTVLAYDKYVAVEGPYAQAASLEEIQSRCDVISFHVPLSDETHHYFNTAFTSAMAQPFYLVNASRGPVASSQAIADGLSQSKILGACLDVLEEEGRDFELKDRNNTALQQLLASDRVLLSPHVAGWTVESYQGLAEVLLERIGSCS